jgi:serine/threonine protein kinase
MPNFEDETVESTFYPKQPNRTQSFTTGQILGGKYKVLALLGKGGMGTVYHVQQIFLNADLALKVLDGKQHLNESQMRRFKLEAKAAYSLNHPGLVKVHDFGLLDNEQPYLVMDLVAGKTLADYLKEFGPMPLDSACDVFAQAADGLYYAHQQSVIHRDIKPSNIMLLDGTKPGAPGTVKIVDFGIAKLIGEDIGEVQALTRTGEVFGSPLYMSPEQCSGELVDQRTDIYSLGCAFFETLTGTPPHVGVNPLRTMMLHKTEKTPMLRDASLGVDFPQSIELIIQKMLAKAPHERYENLDIAAREIAAVSRNAKGQITGQPQKAKPGQPTVSKTSFFQAKPKIFALSILLVLLSTGASGLVIFNNAKKSRHQIESPNSSKLENEQARKTQINSENLILQSSDSINKQIDDNREISRKAFSQAEPIKVVFITENGKKERMINFPKAAIGEYEYEHSDHHLAARGNVKVPAEGHLQLIIGGNFAESFETPTVMKKIAPDIFGGLAISSPNVLIDPEATKSSREKGDMEHLEDVLSSASGWTNLKEVVIVSLLLTKKAVQTISNYKHLEELQIIHVHGSEIELAGQPFLRKLKFIRLSEISATDILKTISSSKALRNLWLEKCDLTENDFEEITKCSSLEELCIKQNSIKQNKLTEPMIGSLLHLKNLRKLMVINVAMVPHQVEELLKSSRLESLTLMGTARKCLDATPLEDRRLHLLDDKEKTGLEALQ